MPPKSPDRSERSGSEGYDWSSWSEAEVSSISNVPPEAESLSKKLQLPQGLVLAIASPEDDLPSSKGGGQVYKLVTLGGRIVAYFSLSMFFRSSKAQIQALQSAINKALEQAQDTHQMQEAVYVDPNAE